MRRVGQPTTPPRVPGNGPTYPPRVSMTHDPGGPDEAAPGGGPDAVRAEIHHTHRDVSGGWLRPAVFGVMDGLVSNVALLSGFAGRNAPRSTAMLAGLAGVAAGAFSMATGEYTSVRSQNEAMAAEIEVERQALSEFPVAER